MTKYVPSCVVDARADAMRPEDATRVSSIIRSGALHNASPELDAIVAEAARVMGMEAAALTVVLGDRQEVVAATGGKRNSVPREASFCTHVVASGELLMINDVFRDPFFVNHPAVEAGHGIRSYCGYPIRTADGETLGALCVVGLQPTVFERARLEEFVAIAKVARHLLLPDAAPIAMPLTPAAGVTQIDPLMTWIERWLAPLDRRSAQRGVRAA